MEQKLNEEKEFRQELQHHLETLRQDFQDGWCKCYLVKVEQLINEPFAGHTGTGGNGAVSGDSGEECYGSANEYPSGGTTDPPRNTTSPNSVLTGSCSSSWLYDNAPNDGSHSFSENTLPAPCGRTLEQIKFVHIEKLPPYSHNGNLHG